MRTLGDVNQQKKLEEEKLAEKLFISMAGNPHYTERYTAAQIVEDAFFLAKEFKAECRDRYEN